MLTTTVVVGYGEILHGLDKFDKMESSLHFMQLGGILSSDPVKIFSELPIGLTFHVLREIVHESLNKPAIDRSLQVFEWMS